MKKFVERNASVLIKFQPDKFSGTIFFLITCILSLCCFQISIAAQSKPLLRIAPFWQGQFNDPSNWMDNNWNIASALPNWGAANIEVRPSSPDETSPLGDNFLRIHYPAGSANAGSYPDLPLGGAQFYGAVVNSNAPITLSYYVLFPVNFPFSYSDGTEFKTTVGKLPGLYGGIGNTGRNVPTGADGWSMRFMWCDYISSAHQNVIGGGQMLQFTVYSDQGLDGTNYGTTLGCNSWRFPTDGQWHNVQQTIHLNDIGQANGRVDICFDGVPVFSQEGITFRTVDTLQTNGVIFQSFFGGKGGKYATPVNTYADFADFALYLYPPSAPAGLCLATA